MTPFFDPDGAEEPEAIAEVDLENLKTQTAAFIAQWKTNRELEQGRKRVGQTGREWMEWLLRFSQCDIETMSVGDFLNLQFELVAVSNFTPPLAYADVSPPPLLASLEGLCVPSKKAAESFRAWVHQTLEAILQKDDSKAPPIPSVRLRVVYDKDNTPHWRVGEEIRSSYSPRYALLLLIMRYAHQVKRCPECNAIFLADKSQQEYCSKRCQAKVAKRRFRAKDPNYVPGRKPGRPRMEAQTGVTKTIKATRTKGMKHGKKGR